MPYAVAKGPVEGACSITCLWELLTIWSIIPSVTPPAILKAAGKLSRPAPRAAFTTMKTAPKDETPPLLLSVSRSRSESTLGLCNNHALSPELMLSTPPQSSTSVWIAMGQQTGDWSAKPKKKISLQHSGSRWGKSWSESLSGLTGNHAVAIIISCPESLVPPQSGGSWCFSKLSPVSVWWWSRSVIKYCLISELLAWQIKNWVCTELILYQHNV